MRKAFLLGIILLFAFIVRIVGINEVPLYGDELTITQDAYSILQTGKDVTGKTLPLTFSMGAGRPGGYVYFSVPFVSLFGPGAYGVRMLSIISGVGIVLAGYLLSRKLFSEKIAIITAFLTAISPWAINLSRGGYEANFALMLCMFAIYAFLEAKGKPICYPISAALFGLTIFTYPTFKLTIPLFIIPLLWYVGGIKEIFVKKNIFYLLVSIIIGISFIGLSINETFNNNSEERFGRINIFSSEDIQRNITEEVINERRIVDVSYADRLFHNKVIKNVEYFIENYLDNFSIQYLFTKGDGNPRHNMTQTGVLFTVEILTLLLGLYAISQKEKKGMIMLLSWVLITPIATSIVGVPHSLRNAFMFPALSMISAYGVFLLSSNKRKIVFTLFVLGLFVQFIFQMERLYLVSAKEYEKSWSYPAKRASEIAASETDRYDHVILSDRIDSVEYAYPVYARVDSKLVQEQNLNTSLIGSLPLKTYGNVSIGRIPEGELPKFIDSIPGSVLFIGSEYYDIKSGEVIKFTDPMLNLSIVRKE